MFHPELRLPYGVKHLGMSMIDLFAGPTKRELRDRRKNRPKRPAGTVFNYVTYSYEELNRAPNTGTILISVNPTFKDIFND